MKRTPGVTKTYLIIPLLLLAIPGCSAGNAAGEKTVGEETVGDPAAVAAQQVQACERAHGLSKASDAKWRTAPKEIGEVSDQTRVFEFCEWPPSPGADADGYSEISVRFAEGPGEDEASWPKAYRITSANCRTFAVALGVSGGTGFIQHLPAMTVASNETKTADGDVWENDGQFSKLPFFPARDEAVVLSSDHYSLDGVVCGEDSSEGQTPETETTTSEGTTEPSGGATTEQQPPEPVVQSCPGLEVGVTIFAEIEASGVSCREVRMLLPGATLSSIRAGQHKWTYAGWTWKVQMVDELRSRIRGSRSGSRISALWATE